MRGIDPANIYVRNGDTLEEDWPFFEEGDVEHYQLVRADAVVSNPPYSQRWNPKNKKHDLRFLDYGVAPKGKADYAFLLHDLYHLEKDGIMTIVLPHGVLFRGNEEYTIRKKLIEKNNIDAIIGLPSNIFFGTSIQTLIMVLKRERTETDVLIIDASRGYEKVGKSNRLRSSDIKRIVDCIRARAVIPKFSVRVSKKKIKENDYNLNIPRYVASYEKPEPWDLHAIMFGGIPNEELDFLEDYWKAFPTLREYLFRPVSERYVRMAFSDIEQAVKNETSVISYKDNYAAAFADLREKLRAVLIEQYSTISAQVEEEKATEDIFKRLESIAVIDQYEAFQVLDNVWNQISADIEIIQTEGETAIMQVDPHMVTKKKNDRDVEVQEGWEGHILPFEIVQEMYLTEELYQLHELQRELATVSASYSDILDSLTDEEKETDILNDAGTEFVGKKVREKANEALEDIESDEINALLEYQTLPQKKKAEFVKVATTVDWSAMAANKKGFYTKAVITARVKELKESWVFPEDSFEAKLFNIVAVMERENAMKREIKAKSADLHKKTKRLIEGMELEQAKAVLDEKWITPIVRGIMVLPENLISGFIAKLVVLQQKYDVTLAVVGERIEATESNVSGYVSKLRGNDYDMAGLAELQKLLGGGD